MVSCCSYINSRKVTPDLHLQKWIWLHVVTYSWYCVAFYQMFWSLFRKKKKEVSKQSSSFKRAASLPTLHSQKSSNASAVCWLMQWRAIDLLLALYHVLNEDTAIYVPGMLWGLINGVLKNHMNLIASWNLSVVYIWYFEPTTSPWYPYYQYSRKQIITEKVPKSKFLGVCHRLSLICRGIMCLLIDLQSLLPYTACIHLNNGEEHTALFLNTDTNFNQAPLRL